MQPPTLANPLASTARHPNPVSAPPWAFRTLLGYARDPQDELTLAFAGVIGRALEAGQRPLIRGLPETEFQRLLDAFFPGARLANGVPINRGKVPSPAPMDELDDLQEMLMESRREPSDALAWLSHAVASAAMRDNHLWQDMGLPNRAFLSRLMAGSFPALAARNVGDMKWKKFFYRQLCERAEVLICKSPNCADCVDYRICFGTEEGESSTVDARAREQGNPARDRGASALDAAGQSPSDVKDRERTHR